MLQAHWTISSLWIVLSPWTIFLSSITMVCYAKISSSNHSQAYIPCQHRFYPHFTMNSNSNNSQIAVPSYSMTPKSEHTSKNASGMIKLLIAWHLVESPSKHIFSISLTQPWLKIAASFYYVSLTLFIIALNKASKMISLSLPLRHICARNLLSGRRASLIISKQVCWVRCRPQRL